MTVETSLVRLRYHEPTLEVPALIIVIEILSRNGLFFYSRLLETWSQNISDKGRIISGIAKIIDLISELLLFAASEPIARYSQYHRHPIIHRGSTKGGRS